MKSQKDTGDYSFRTGTLKLASGTVTYTDEGEGSPIVIVHGTPSWSSLYRPLLKKLSSHHRCIAIDTYTSEHTGKQQDWSYNPKSHTEMLAQLLNNLQLSQVTLLLHDAGAPAGLAYAIQQADRIKNLILLNTSSCSFSRNNEQGSSSNRPTLHLGRLLYARLHAFRPTLAKKLAASEASDKGTHVAPVAEELADVTIWYNEQWNNRHAIQDITTLLLWGECDKLTSMKSLQKWKQFFHECYVIHLENSTYSLEGGNMEDIAVYLKNFIMEEHRKRETMSLPT